MRWRVRSGLRTSACLIGAGLAASLVLAPPFLAGNLFPTVGLRKAAAPPKRDADAAIIPATPNGARQTASADAADNTEPAAVVAAAPEPPAVTVKPAAAPAPAPAPEPAAAAPQTAPADSAPPEVQATTEPSRSAEPAFQTPAPQESASAAEEKREPDVAKPVRRTASPPVRGTPLIPPADMPAESADAAPAPRGPLPLETDLLSAESPGSKPTEEAGPASAAAPAPPGKTTARRPNG